MGGYWLHIAGNWANGTVSGVEVGAFVDGPELDNDPVPTSGTATYRGLAGGLFAARFGTDDPNVPAGTHEIGEYNGEFMATADFGAGTVSGSIAVTRVVGIGETPAGQTYDFDNAYEARLILDPASIDAATGTLEGRVRLVVPGVTVTSQDGSWGSRLSNRNDGNGHPRALAGTHAGAATTTGGSEVAYIGAHFGTTGNF